MVIALREKYKESDEDCFDRIIKSRSERYGESRKKLKNSLREMVDCRSIDNGSGVASIAYHWPVENPVCMVSCCIHMSQPQL